jgi:hypothetical protein
MIHFSKATEKTIEKPKIPRDKLKICAGPIC